MRNKVCRPKPTNVLKTMSIEIPNQVSFFTTIQYTPNTIKPAFAHRFAIASSSISACLPVCFAAITPRTTPVARGKRTKSFQPRETDRESIVLSIRYLYRNTVRNARTPK
jgi:hypothetical protein